MANSAPLHSGTPTTLPSRPDYTFPGGGGKAGSWSSRPNDANQWLQIDLGITNAKVTGLASQGRADADQWVTKYKLQYSHDGVHFYFYREPGQGVAKVSPPIN